MTTERARVDIRLLGPVGADREGESIALGGPRQRAVLARLALVVGQTVTVDRLIEDVWGGDPPPTALNTLQSYISLLRRALGGPDVVRREGPGYVLDTPRHALDALRFEDDVAAGMRVLASDPTRALAHFDTALDEWRGPCLADVADDEWARAAAVRWDELRLTATEARFDALLALGRHAEAAPGLERAVNEHPLREGLVRRQMIALYRSGRQAEALRAFTRTRALLAEELGLDPTPELAALQRAILDHDPDLAGDPAADPAPAGVVAPTVVEPVPPPAPAGLPLPGQATRAVATTFVGRDAGLADLHRLWSAASHGERQVALVVGEAGAGKSSLAARFASDVHADGATVLWGRASREAVVPFEPFVQALRTALHSLSPRDRDRVVADRVALATLLPELPRLVPSLRSERPPPGLERYLLFETVADLLEVESRANPILLVLDDVHWADALSVKLLEHVLRHDRPSRVMVLGTARVPSEDPNPELDRLVLELTRDGLLTRVSLDGLGEDDVGEILLAAGRDPGAAKELVTATGGNAFFVTELLAGADERGPLGDELPDSIRTMMGVRLDHLSPTAANVLALAAVAGPSASLPVLVAAAGLAADDVLDAADDAIAAGLLVEDGAGRLVPPHALVRQAVLARISRTRRSDLHRRIGEAIAIAGGSDATAAEVAHHLLEAGALVAPGRRIDAIIAAGDEALATLAYEDAAAWAERGRALTVDGAPDPAALHLVRSGAARALGDRATAVAAARDAHRLARSCGDPVMAARALQEWVLSISAVGFDFGQPADKELIDALTTAIEDLPTAQVAHHVRLRTMLVSVLVDSGDHERQERVSAEAMAIARADGSSGLLASAQHARRLALWRRDRLDERTGAALDAVDHARRSGDVHLELTAMLFAMTDLMEAGKVDEHLAMFERFQARAATLRTPLYDVYALFLRSCRALVVGDYGEAERIAGEALAAGLTSHGANAEMAYAGQMFCLAWDRGQLGDALPLVEHMAGENPELVIWQIALVASLIEAERADDARVVFERIVGPDGVALADDSMFFTGCCFLAEAARVLDDPVRADVIRATLAPYAGRIAVTGLGGVGIGPVSRYVGVAAHMSGDADAAVFLLQQAIVEAERLGARPFTARARRDLARALADRDRPGDDVEAARQAALAEAEAAEIGLVLGAF